MPLSAGTRLGPYEILSALGAGGMGEVYKARDTRLDRLVAVKILPPALADDPQFRERFDREARAISRLTHHHICTLYDVGRSEARSPEGPRHAATDVAQGAATDVAQGFSPANVEFLVMELLDGETLADRLKQGALPLDHAVKVAIQIADALSTAHRHGIVHRDIKPGNIFLIRGGGASAPPVAKLLDFGLAKTSRPAFTGAALSTLPTTGANLTAPGTILGTFQYMAPEQLESGDADARTDIFAFGAVLYEMLTGRKAFEGKSHASLIGAILHADPPPVSQVQPVAPASLNRLVATCLAKAPDDRWQSARDLLRELQWVAEGSTSLDSAARAAQAAPRSAWSRALPWAVAGVLGVALIAVVVSSIRSREKPPATPVTRLSITPPEKNRLSGRQPAVSPDGRQVVFAATSDDGKRQLWLRPLDSLTAQPLAGTDNAIFPFWSPDNTSIGFFAAGKLQRMNVSGGPATTLADASPGRGGTWSPDGVIVFAPSQTSGLYQVAASGGVARRATRVGPGPPAQKYPFFFPDGRHFLYLFGAGGSVQRSIRVGSLDSPGEDRTLLDSADSSAMYAQGHLWFVRGTTLMARPFDAKRLAFTAEEVPVAEHVAGAEGLQAWAFSVSASGVLAYESTGVRAHQLTSMDRAGQPLGTVGDPGDLFYPRFSPDRRTAAVTVPDASGSGSDIRLYDMSRGLGTRFTSDPASNGEPTWSPDGGVIVFHSNRAGRFDLYRKPADGSRNDELLHTDGLVKAPKSFSPDGAYLAYAGSGDPKTGSDIWILPGPLGAPGASKPSSFMRTDFNEAEPQFSPDGHWIAYQSNESGRYEVYVAPFPGPGGKRQVSTSGGRLPRWRADGKELFYLAADNRLTAAEVDAKGGAFEVKRVETLFGPVVRGFDVSADGRRFLTPVPGGVKPTRC